MYTYISETYIVVVFSLFPSHFLVGFCLKNRTKRTQEIFSQEHDFYFECF